MTCVEGEQRQPVSRSPEPGLQGQGFQALGRCLSGRASLNADTEAPGHPVGIRLSVPPGREAIVLPDFFVPSSSFLKLFFIHPSVSVLQ